MEFFGAGYTAQLKMMMVLDMVDVTLILLQLANCIVYRRKRNECTTHGNVERFWCDGFRRMSDVC